MLKSRQWMIAAGLAFAVLACLWFIRTMDAQRGSAEGDHVNAQLQAWLASTDTEKAIAPAVSAPVATPTPTADQNEHAAASVMPLESAASSNNVQSTIAPAHSVQPTTGQPEETAAPAPNNAVQSGKTVNINTASEGQLTTLPGIGPSKAKAIIAYREQKGGFKTKYELTKVKGIGEKTYLKLEALISIS